MPDYSDMRGKSVRSRAAPATESRKSKVTVTNEREATALKTLFEAHQQAKLESGVRVTQASFGADNHIGSQGLVTQYLNAKIPLNLRVAVAFAKGLRCEVSAFSERLAAEQAQLSGKAKPAVKTGLETVLQLNPLEQQLLGLYRDLPPDQRDELLQAANRMHAKAHPGQSAANPYPQKARGKSTVKDET